MLIRKVQSLEEILLPNKRSSPSSDLFTSSIKKQETIYQSFWLKQDDGVGLPLFMVPDALDFETLFADVSTFHQGISPLSAYTYICSKEIELQLFLEQKKPKSRIKFDERKLKIDIALILGEAVTATFLVKKELMVANIGYSACTQTLAASVARSRMLYPTIKPSVVSERWELARKLTNQETSVVPSKLTVEFSEMLGGERSSSDSATLFFKNVISDKRLLEYFVDIFDLRAESIKIKGVYNARISVFNSIVEKVESSNEAEVVKSACIAFFCNEILPGSMNHVASLKSYIERYPDIVFWYTAYACISPDFDIKTSMSGICFKLARDILRPFSIESRPSCDVSVDELDIISRVSMKASILKPKGHRVVVVSLLPGVDVELVLGIPESVKQSQVSAPEIDSVDNQKLKSLLYDALDVLNKSSFARNRTVKSYSKNNEKDL